jgi:hypothetical protein
MMLGLRTINSTIKHFVNKQVATFNINREIFASFQPKRNSTSECLHTKQQRKVVDGFISALLHAGDICGMSALQNLTEI